MGNKRVTEGSGKRRDRGTERGSEGGRVRIFKVLKLTEPAAMFLSNMKSSTTCLAKLARAGVEPHR